MNNQSPLVPQGSLLEQKNKGRARVKIAVFFVLTIHGVALLALLMQGCQKEKETSAKTEPTSATTPAFDASNAQPAETAANVLPTNTPANVDVAAPLAPVAAGAVTEYAVAKGDKLSTIASNFKIPLKALVDANPGVEPTKLRIGQKLHIPPAPPTVASVTPVAPASVAPSGGEQLYTVKSGDTLIKIGSQFRTSAKAIRAANSLKTDSIKVGQKLKIPAKAMVTASNDTAVNTTTTAAR